MSNPYRDLLSILPQRTLALGDVIAYSGGIATVELLDGGIVTARGSASVSDRVYVRDGLIEGGSPTLSVTNIDI